MGHGDTAHHLRVAVAESPYGPFDDCDVHLTADERFAIDPHPFRDVLDAERVGSADWQIFARDREIYGVRDWHTLEGPSVRHLLLPFAPGATWSERPLPD